MPQEFIKFLVVGGLSTLINYGVFYLLLQWLGVHYLISSGVGYIVGLLVGYLLNRHWTFHKTRSHDRRIREIVLYIAVYLFSLVLSLGVIALLVNMLHLNALLANVFAIGVSTMTNFIGLKLFVFHAQKTRSTI